jgi:hypothetical protein
VGHVADGNRHARSTVEGYGEISARLAIPEIAWNGDAPSVGPGKGKTLLNL